MATFFYKKRTGVEVMKQNKRLILRFFPTILAFALIVWISPQNNDEWVRPRVIEIPTHTQI